MKTLRKIKDLSIQKAKPCVVCGKEESRKLYTYTEGTKESNILECCDCKHLFLYPVPLPELKDRNMEGISEAEFFGDPFLQWLHEKITFNREIKEIRKLVTEKPRLLDIGCGTGWSTSVWQKNGFDATGLEPSAGRAE